MGSLYAEPLITVDIGRNRIRLHRSTLKRLADPLYVRLLVNPERKGIVIEQCDERSPGACRLNTQKNTHSVELYSPSLVQAISACAGFDQYRTVVLTGRQLLGQKAVLFQMKVTEGTHDGSVARKAGYTYESIRPYN